LVFNVIFFYLGMYTCFHYTWQLKTEFIVRLTYSVSAIDAIYEECSKLTYWIKYYVSWYICHWFVSLISNQIMYFHSWCLLYLIFTEHSAMYFPNLAWHIRTINQSASYNQHLRFCLFWYFNIYKYYIPTITNSDQWPYILLQCYCRTKIFKTVGSHIKHDDVLYIAFFTCPLMSVYLLSWWWWVFRLKHVAFK